MDNFPTEFILWVKIYIIH